MKFSLKNEKNQALAVFIIGSFILSGVEYVRFDGFFSSRTVFSEVEEVRFSSVDALQSFFMRQGYSLPSWRERSQPVPRLILTSIPAAWGTNVASALTVEDKKTIFLMLALPLVLVSNEELMQLRERVQKFDDRNAGLQDRKWLQALSGKYGLEKSLSDQQRVHQLLERIDHIPTSIALAQMIEESGWGTSRFAAEGNALFGQWTYKEGLKPQQQREEIGDYRIRAFETPLDSVRAYMLNLNTNPAYAAFRKKRATFRQTTKKVKGAFDLIKTLGAYSERGEEYIDTLKSIIQVNDLLMFDHASLQEKPVYSLKPSLVSG